MTVVAAGRHISHAPMLEAFIARQTIRLDPFPTHP